MLQLGGNPWRGGVYGITTRYGWTTDGVFCNPNVWKVWDGFGIATSKMMGYWEDKSVVKTSNNEVLATVYPAFTPFFQYCPFRFSYVYKLITLDIKHVHTPNVI